MLASWADAQEPLLTRGARVRLTLKTPRESRVARFEELTDTTLVLSVNSSARVVPLSNIERIEWSQGRKPGILGGVVGFLVGGALGGVAGCAANRDSYGVFCGGQSDTKVAVGTAIGGIAGAALGAYLGRHDRWTVVALPRRSRDIDTEFLGPDSGRVERLKAHGQVIEQNGVVVWAPPEMPSAWLHALSDTLSRGIRAARELVGSVAPWSRLGNRRITYYISPDPFISHATGKATVFLPWWRVRNGTAPYKYETLHELLHPPAPYWPEEFTDSIASREIEKNTPLWLIEGLPDYLAARIEAEQGLREGDVFNNGGTAGVDRSCRERERSDTRNVIER
jgi:hypothetical protein